MKQRILSIDNQQPTEDEREQLMSIVCQNCYKKFKSGDTVTFVVLDDGMHAWHKPKTRENLCTNR